MIKLLRIGNHIININHICQAEYHQPDEDTTNDRLQCTLSFTDGSALILEGDEADEIWFRLSDRALVEIKVPVGKP